MSYQICTSVVNSTSTITFEKILTVLVLVDSKSNLVAPYYPVDITNETQFFFYFPDILSSYSPSLKTAFRLLSNGYRLLACNVHSCNHKLALRMFDDDSQLYFDEESTLRVINTVLQKTENLAIKIDISTFNSDAFILLEHKVNGISSNTLLYSTNSIPINSINYQAGMAFRIDPELSLQEKVDLIYNILTTKRSYTVSKDADGKTLHIAYPYGFESIANYSNTASIEWDIPFELQYLNSIYEPKRVFDLQSKYKSDIEDLEVLIELENEIYTITIYKYYDENNISTTEIFTGSQDEIIDEINSMSKFLSIQLYKDAIKPGKYKLENKYPESLVEEEDYYDCLVYLYQFKDNGRYEFSCNIVYEPDIHSSLIQNAILMLFGSIDLPMIKFLTYLDLGTEFNESMVAYFDNNRYIMENEEYGGKELALILLIRNMIGKSLVEIQLSSLDSFVVPTYVNKYSIEYKNIYLNEIKVLLNNKVFNLFDFLVMSVLDVMIDTTDEQISKYLIYDFIEVIDNYFTDYLGYNPNISLESFETVTEDTVSIKLNYYTKTNNEIKNLNLVLNINN